MQCQDAKIAIKFVTMPIGSTNSSMMYKGLLILAAVVGCLNAAVLEARKSKPSSSLSCKNPDGKDVEWFIIYKLSKSGPEKDIPNTIKTNGGEMAYIDSNSKDGKWELLEASIYDDEQPIADTLAPLYQGSAPKDIAYAVYSDQVPEPYKGTAAGHAKGVLMFNKKQGVWLTHSVPRFPANLFAKKYEYPESGRNNGQVLMCVTMKYDQLPTIAKHLQVQFPKVYEGDAPADIIKDVPELEDIVDGKNARKLPPYLVDDLKGIDGTVFKSFAKHHTYKDDVYSGLIAPKLDVDLLVETWRNGAGNKLPSVCPKNGLTVTNMANVVVSFSNTKDVVAFSTREDHAKWALSDDATQPWFCASSINRMESQFKRGGETLCIKNKVAHKAFSSVVDKCDTCSRRPSEICKRHEEV